MVEKTDTPFDTGVDNSSSNVSAILPIELKTSYDIMYLSVVKYEKVEEGERVSHTMFPLSSEKPAKKVSATLAGVECNFSFQKSERWKPGQQATKSEYITKGFPLSRDSQGNYISEDVQLQNYRIISQAFGGNEEFTVLYVKKDDSTIFISSDEYMKLA